MLGIFDSGMGGLVVAREIKRRRPDLKLVYFGDTARTPWGSKSKKVVQGYSREIVQFLEKKGCQEIVIACNTASVLAGDFLKKTFPHLKFYNAVDSAMERIRIENEKKKQLRIGVIGTKGTIESGVYQKRISDICGNNALVVQTACPLFVPMVEEDFPDKEIVKKIVRHYLFPMIDEVDFLILGCTHYPLLEKEIGEIMSKRVTLINSAKELATTIAKKEKSEVRKKRKDEYYFSDLSKHCKGVIEKIIGKGEELKEVAF